MKNSLFSAILFLIIGCTSNGPEYSISVKVHESDTLTMEAYYDYEAQLSQDAHGGQIERSMKMLFQLLPGVGDFTDRTMSLIPIRLQMYQDIPGSGKQNIDTDLQDSATGFAAKMTLQRFTPLIKTRSKIVLDSLGNIKSQAWNEVIKRTGISDLAAFFENHPIHIGLDDGRWFKGKNWENKISYMEAGIPMNGTAVYTVDSCGPTHCYVHAIKNITPPEQYQEYSLTGKISITGQIAVNRDNGLIESQTWNESIHLEIHKGKEVIPVRIKRTGGYRSLKY